MPIRSKRWISVLRIAAGVTIAGLVAVILIGMVIANELMSYPKRPLEVRIDATLRADRDEYLPDGSPSEWHKELLADGRAHLTSRRCFPRCCRIVDVWFRPKAGGLPEVELAARTEASADPSQRWPFFGLGGTLWANASVLPDEGQAPLVIAYDLEGDCSGSPVRFGGTVTVFAEELRR